MARTTLALALALPLLAACSGTSAPGDASDAVGTDATAADSTGDTVGNDTTVADTAADNSRVDSPSPDGTDVPTGDVPVADTLDVRPPMDGGCSGPVPSGACVMGTPGGICGDAALAQQCIGGAWMCPSGTIPISMCACVGRPPGACTCTPSGWSCPDAGDVAPPVDVACTDCVSSTVSWGMNGGRVLFQDRSSVASCRVFTFHRMSFGGPPDRMCSNDVPGCSATARPNIADLQAALADPDVVAALAMAPVLYGRDTRPSDGTVFQIQVGSRLVEIGVDCAGASGCRPVPPGVARLRTLLESISAAQLRIGMCATVFPGGP